MQTFCLEKWEGYCRQVLARKGGLLRRVCWALLPALCCSPPRAKFCPLSDWAAALPRLALFSKVPLSRGSAQRPWLRRRGCQGPEPSLTDEC